SLVGEQVGRLLRVPLFLEVHVPDHVDRRLFRAVTPATGEREAGEREASQAGESLELGRHQSSTSSTLTEPVSSSSLRVFSRLYLGSVASIAMKKRSSVTRANRAMLNSGW